MDKYDRDADFPQIYRLFLSSYGNGVCSIVQVFKGCGARAVASSVTASPKGPISSFGVNLWGLYYSGSEILVRVGCSGALI